MMFSGINKMKWLAQCSAWLPSAIEAYECQMVALPVAGILKFLQFTSIEPHAICDGSLSLCYEKQWHTKVPKLFHTAAGLVKPRTVWKFN